MTEPIFHFRLRELSAIQPWGTPDAPTLSWFGLTDGWYWLTLGGQELFRDLPQPGHPEPELPYADYTVVRLWEDVLTLLPDALAPLPDALAEWIEADPVGACLRTMAFLRSMDGKPCRGEVEEAYVGLEWFSHRRLSEGHIAGPRLCVWRVKDQVRLTWWSDSQWEYDVFVEGTLTMHVDAFIDEVKRFDGAFLGAMTAHVTQLVAQGGLPGVRIDLNQVEMEDVSRSRWFARAMSKAERHTPDWEPALAWFAANAHVLAHPAEQAKTPA